GRRQRRKRRRVFRDVRNLAGHRQRVNGIHYASRVGVQRRGACTGFIDGGWHQLHGGASNGVFRNHAHHQRDGDGRFRRSGRLEHQPGGTAGDKWRGVRYGNQRRVQRRTGYGDEPEYGSVDDGGGHERRHSLFFVGIDLGVVQRTGGQRSGTWWWSGVGTDGYVRRFDRHTRIIRDGGSSGISRHCGRRFTRGNRAAHLHHRQRHTERHSAHRRAVQSEEHT